MVAYIQFQHLFGKKVLSYYLLYFAIVAILFYCQKRQESSNFRYGIKDK